MSLRFTDGGATYVDWGSAASLDDLTDWTGIAWLKKTGTQSASRDVFAKGPFNSNFWLMAIGGTDGTDGRLFIFQQLSTTSVNSASTVAADLTTNVWYFCAVTYNNTTKDGKVYHGTLTSSIALDGTHTGAGSKVGSDAASTLYTCRQGATNQGIAGDIAYQALYNRVLTLGELQGLQFRPVPLSGCVLSSWLGFNGTGTQADWSGNGNNGTVTGATVSDNVPLGPTFGFDYGWRGTSQDVFANMAIDHESAEGEYSAVAY